MNPASPPQTSRTSTRRHLPFPKVETLTSRKQYQSHANINHSSFQDAESNQFRDEHITDGISQHRPNLKHLSPKKTAKPQSNSPPTTKMHRDTRMHVKQILRPWHRTTTKRFLLRRPCTTRRDISTLIQKPLQARRAAGLARRAALFAQQAQFRR